MDSSLRDKIPRALFEGKLRARHIVLFYIACVCVSAAILLPATRSADPELRRNLIQTSVLALASMLMIGIAAVIPEMRRGLSILYSRSRVPLRFSDVALYLSVALTWAFGLNMLLINLPLVVADPDLFGVLGFRTQPVEVDFRLTIILAVGVLVVAPIGEELVFRGFLQNLWMQRFGIWPGMLLSAAAFGLVHGRFALFATVVGIFLSLVYLRFGSLWPGMIMHSTYNLIVFPSGPLCNFYLVKDPSRLGSLQSWLWELAASAAFIPCIVLFWRRFRPVQ